MFGAFTAVFSSDAPKPQLNTNTTTNATCRDRTRGHMPDARKPADATQAAGSSHEMAASAVSGRRETAPNILSMRENVPP